MERRAFDTSLGDIWLRGRPAAFDGDQPLVLAIAGAFGHADALNPLADAVADADVLLAHLPGNHCPGLREPTVEGFASAFDEVVGQLGRPTIVLGVSAGALVALAMRSPRLAGIVAADPPLRTANLWPIIPAFRRHAASDPDVAAFVLNVFGIGPAEVTGRDYTPLLDDPAAPTICLVGDDRLEPERTCDSMPSLVDAVALEALRRHPGIALRLVPGVGHEISRLAGRHMLTAIRELLRPVASPKR